MIMKVVKVDFTYFYPNTVPCHWIKSHSMFPTSTTTHLCILAMFPVQNYISHTLNPQSDFIILLRVVTAMYTETQEVHNTKYSRTPNTCYTSDAIFTQQLEH
jgi:hypothetical protein